VTLGDFDYDRHYFPLGGHQMHYVDEGPKDAPVLLMVHGNPTWSYYFRHLIQAFSRDFRVVVPDHLGCGLSDKPQDFSYTLEAHCNHLSQLIQHLDLKQITLLVHDWGGAIGFGAAVAAPERFEKFVVFNTAAFFVPRLPARIAVCRIPVLGELLVRGLNGFVLASFFFATSRPERFDRTTRKGYLAPYDSWRHRVAIHRFVQDIPMREDHPTRKTLQRIEEGLGQFQSHPMKVFWGMDDFCFTAQHFLCEWEKRFPQAEVHRLNGAGHYVVEDAQEHIIPMLQEWLNPTQVG
jgi:haloalkane dehalogenase